MSGGVGGEQRGSLAASYPDPVVCEASSEAHMLLFQEAEKAICRSRIGFSTFLPGFAYENRGA